MPIASANGLEIAYDEFGDAKAPVILLIMGLGTQMIAWPEPFCRMLVERGFRVVRFDNRDIGLSTKFDAAGPADVTNAFMRAVAGQPVESLYKLSDMAADTAGLMDTLGIARAHIVGASMGGMIAQTFAATYPARTRSLVSIMSSSGDPSLPPAKDNAIAALLGPRPDPGDREKIVTHGMNVYRVIGSPGFPTSDEELRAKIEASADRSYYPVGVGRQLVAVLASGSRVDLLKTITVPTLVIHGADDPLVPVEAGKDTAKHVPAARLQIVPGMGHDLAPGLVPILAEAIAGHCLAADAQSEPATA
ncbi:MAG: alpha/beta hydrolase [Xanthobacteraceae bacterium]